MPCSVLGTWLVVDRCWFFSVYELGDEKTESGWSFLPSKWLEQLIQVSKCLKPSHMQFPLSRPLRRCVAREAARPCPQARPRPASPQPAYSCPLPWSRGLLAQLALISLSLSHFSVFIRPCLCFLANKCHVFPTGFFVASLFYPCVDRARFRPFAPAAFPAPSEPNAAAFWHLSRGPGVRDVPTGPGMKHPGDGWAGSVGFRKLLLVSICVCIYTYIYYIYLYKYFLYTWNIEGNFSDLYFSSFQHICKYRILFIQSHSAWNT